MKDMILKDANIYNFNLSNNNRCENSKDSILISSGRIAKKDSFEILKEKYPRADIVDLQGKTVIPGFIDSHIHLLQTGYTRVHLNLAGVTSLDTLKKSIKSAAREKKPGEWIIGTSFDENNFAEKKLPTKDDLDEAAPFNPVFIIRVCTHLFVVNSRALELVGIGKNTPSPPGGIISRDNKGFPNGILKESAADRIYDFINSNYQLQKEALRAAIREVKSYGITTVHDMAIGVKEIEHYEKLIEIYREVLKEEGYPLRIILGVEHMLFDDILKMGFNYLQGDDYFRQGYVKIFADGSFGGRTALLKNKYQDTGDRGLEAMEESEIEALVKKASGSGYQCAVHAIGDEALEKSTGILSKYNTKALRHRIVHASLADESLIKFITRNNLGIDFQPGFLASELHWITKIFSPEQLRNLYSWKSFNEKGALLAAGSDSPVEPVSPFYGVRSAVLRQNTSNLPEGCFYPQEKLALEEILSSYTYSGAYQYFEEEYKGRIEENYFADMVVLSTDPFDLKPEDLDKVTPYFSFVGGRMIYGERSLGKEYNI